MHSIQLKRCWPRVVTNEMKTNELLLFSCMKIVRSGDYCWCFTSFEFYSHSENNVYQIGLGHDHESLLLLTF